MHCPIPNESQLDRLARFFVAETLLILGFFWLGGFWQIAVYVLSIVVLMTALTGFCGLYRLLGWDTTRMKWQPKGRIVLPIFVVVYAVLALAGGYTSDFFTRKFFLEDYNRMNNDYKQTLFTTGQGQREISIENYGQLVDGYSVFMGKYTGFRPFFLRSDASFDADLGRVQTIISSLKETIASGDLAAAHIELEQIRPVFQDMFKRNGFSMLAVYLVDFHDSMEKVIEAADAKSPSGVIETYAEADAKLKEVEAVANDEEIQAIRANLDAVIGLARQEKVDELSAKAAELKSSFVKVYLKRG